jgi:hypothetical protein
MLFREIEARDINARSCLRESLELESISNRVSEDSELVGFITFGFYFRILRDVFKDSF